MTAPDTVEHDGWALVLRDGEPLVADDVLAAHLATDRRKLRELIRRHQHAGNVTPTEVYPTVGQTGGRPGQGFLLTEPDALFIVTRSEAPRAIEMTKAMIRVFLAVRLRLVVPGVASAPTAPRGDDLGRTLVEGAPLEQLPGVGRRGVPTDALLKLLPAPLRDARLSSGLGRLIGRAMRAQGWEHTRQRWPSLGGAVAYGWLAPLAASPEPRAALPPPPRDPRLYAQPMASLPSPAAPTVLTFRAQTEYPWPELKRAAAEVSCRPIADQHLEAVGDCPIPPGANVCPGLVRDLAWVLLAWVPPRPRAA